MAVTKSLQNLVDDIRAVSGIDTSQSSTDTQITVWTNDALRRLWSIASRVARDEYVKLSSSFTVSSGDTVTHLMGSGGDGASDFMEVRGVDIQFTSGLWYRLRPLRFSARDKSGGVTWRAFKNTIWFFPPLTASQFTYRVWYVPTPQVLVNGAGSTYAASFVNMADTADLPLSGDDYIVHDVAAKVRIRAKEDPTPHQVIRDQSVKEMRAWLIAHNRGEPVEPAEALQDDTYGLW